MQNGNQKRARENQKRARERATRALRAYTYAGVNNYRERPGIRSARAKARARVPVQAWICTEIVVEICVPAAAVERICFIFLFMFLKILWKSIREFAGYLVAAIFHWIFFKTYCETCSNSGAPGIINSGALNGICWLPRGGDF